MENREFLMLRQGFIAVEEGVVTFLVGVRHRNQDGAVLRGKWL